jgi:hypothetical protein
MEFPQLEDTDFTAFRVREEVGENYQLLTAEV